MGGVSETRIPVGVRRVFRHVPVEVRRAIIPPYGAALTERLLDLVNRSVRGRFSLTVFRTPRLAVISLSTRSALLALARAGFAMRHGLPRTTKYRPSGVTACFTIAKPISAAT
jgi:hypothetical protein